jgi:hypothetical protein
MLAKWKADEAKIKEEVNAFYEMRERGNAEGRTYLEKMSAKWKAERDKANANFERMMAKWRTDRKMESRKKEYEEKMIAEQKAEE